jgi:hypothetical protein
MICCCIIVAHLSSTILSWLIEVSRLVDVSDESQSERRLYHPLSNSRETDENKVIISNSEFTEGLCYFHSGSLLYPSMTRLRVSTVSTPDAGALFPLGYSRSCPEIPDRPCPSSSVFVFPVACYFSLGIVDIGHPRHNRTVTSAGQKQAGNRE